jgi:hypothetical protein
MHKMLSAIALVAAMQAAAAAQVPGPVSTPLPRAAQDAAGPGLMQTSMVVGGANGARQDAQRAPMQSTLQAEAAPEPSDRQDREPGTAMLLAALLLMLGIALRRWGAGQQ